MPPGLRIAPDQSLAEGDRDTTTLHASFVSVSARSPSAFARCSCGLLALYAALADTPAEPRALRGLVLGVTGIGLVVPAVGVEVFAMPVIGGLYFDGVTGVAPALASIYRGPMTAGDDHGPGHAGHRRPRAGDRPG